MDEIEVKSELPVELLSEIIATPPKKGRGRPKKIKVEDDQEIIPDVEVKMEEEEVESMVKVEDEETFLKVEEEETFLKAEEADTFVKMEEEESFAKTEINADYATPLMMDGTVPFKRGRGRPRKDGSWPIPRKAAPEIIHFNRLVGMYPAEEAEEHKPKRPRVVKPREKVVVDPATLRRSERPAAHQYVSILHKEAPKRFEEGEFPKRASARHKERKVYVEPEVEEEEDEEQLIPWNRRADPKWRAQYKKEMEEKAAKEEVPVQAKGLRSLADKLMEAAAQKKDEEKARKMEEQSKKSKAAMRKRRLGGRKLKELAEKKREKQEAKEAARRAKKEAKALARLEARMARKEVKKEIKEEVKEEIAMQATISLFSTPLEEPLILV